MNDGILAVLECVHMIQWMMMNMRNEERIEYALSNIRKALELVPDCDGVATIELYNQLLNAEHHLTRSE